jgi:hypothetical protein
VYQGVRDVLELGRRKRSPMYNHGMDSKVPTVLAPRRRREAVPVTKTVTHAPQQGVPGRHFAHRELLGDDRAGR